MPPGRECAHAIIHSGITVVKYDEFYNKNTSEAERQQEQDIKDAKDLLRQSDILLM